MTIDFDLKLMGIHMIEARHLRGYLQSDVAEMIGVSDSYYGRIERGQVKVPLNRIISICVALETPVLPIIAGCCKELDTLSLPTNIPPEKKNMLLLIDSVSTKDLKVMYNVCAKLVEEYNRPD